MNTIAKLLCNISCHWVLTSQQIYYAAIQRADTKFEIEIDVF